MAKATHERFEGLDALRGIAAIGVVVYHTCAFAQVSPPHFIAPLVKQLWLGVQMFFILSAFGLCLGYYGRLGTKENIIRYGIRRLFRIVPLFYAMFPVYIWMNQGSVHEATFGKLVANVLFLFQIVPEKGQEIVWASWSLAIEMQFYLLLPLLLMILTTWQRALIGLAAALVLAMIYQNWAAELDFHGAWLTLAAQLPFFVLGILGFHLFGLIRQRGSGLQGRFAVIALLTAITIAVAAKTLGVGRWALGTVAIYPYVIGIALLLLILSQAAKPSLVIVNRATKFLGERAYSVYLVHSFVVMQLLEFIRGTIYGPDHLKDGALLPFLAAVCLTAGVSVAIASATYQFIELPFIRLGARIIERRRKALNCRLLVPAFSPGPPHPTALELPQTPAERT